MRIFGRLIYFSGFFISIILDAPAQTTSIQIEKIPYKIYPDVNDVLPDLPSPFISSDGIEYVIAVTKNEHFAIIDVSLSNERNICRQLVTDGTDFPVLAADGIHSEEELNRTKTITGLSVDEITESGRPNRLSQAGFLAEDETILSVIKADNKIVQKLGLTHPELAKPLFHVLNMIDTDLELNRWNMAIHRWENIRYFFYNNRKIFVEAEDTKGGQKSIFNDQIEGGFYIKLWRDVDSDEQRLLKNLYPQLSPAKSDSLKSLLSTINTGEIEPQYIMRYGFYEGHTFWRTDPIAISFIFGLKDLAAIERAFPEKLYDIMTTHFTE